jgi:ornithine decarboxylase
MVEPFYAMKCNPDPVIVRLLATLGCGFDCATMGEIDLVLNGLGKELSFSPRGLTHDKLVYANPAKFQNHLEFATSSGVRKTVFDGEDELYKLAKVNDSLPEGQKLELLLRITTNDEKSVCSFSNKFGCPVSQGPELLEVAKKLGLDVVGVSFHVGSGCGDPAAYSIAFDHASRLFQAADQLGMKKMTLVDIGGGFPGDNEGTYRAGMPTFLDIAATVRKAIADFRVKFTADRQLRFIAEPGRYFVSRSTTIATKIYGRKGGMGKTQALYIDDGVYGSFNNVVYDHYHPVPIKLTSALESHDDEESNAQMPTAVFGPTCDGLDQICKQQETMLERAEIGDWLIFKNMGAYTHTASFVFNGYTHIPKKVHCISTVGYDEDSSMSADEDANTRQ